MSTEAPTALWRYEAALCLTCALFALSEEFSESAYAADPHALLPARVAVRMFLLEHDVQQRHETCILESRHSAAYRKDSRTALCEMIQHTLASK